MLNTTVKVLLAISLLATAGHVYAGEDSPPRVTIETSMGTFVIEFDPRRAPTTTENFLRYVDAGLYDGGRFHRAVRIDNQRRQDVLIEVVQARIDPARRTEGFPSIRLERTEATGILHLDGTSSMARGGVDSARSDIFICIADQPSLDFGGARNADGQGFAAFGRVVRGMDVIRRIQASPTRRETLKPAVRIESVRRLQ